VSAVGKRTGAQIVGRERVRRQRLEREARRQVSETGAQPVAIHPDDGRTDGDRRRLAATTCGWCGGAITPKLRGRIPKWCSAACRQRAWEQSRAAASGRSAVTVIERRVEIPVRALAGFEDGRQPMHGEWVSLLRQLAGQLDTGAIYVRDTPELSAALNEVLSAYERHPGVRKRR